MSRDGQARFMFFSALLIMAPFTLPVHAIRGHQEHNSNSVLSLTLHHSDSITNPNTHNHSSRTKMRMEADVARVNYLNSRLRNALFKSADSSFEAENVQSQLSISGGEYVAQIGVGQPATESTLVADTGSSLVWLKCSPCSQCSDPIFDPSTSSSYKMLSCADPLCSTGICAAASNDGAGTCAFNESYGDHSTSQGDFITETLLFGSSGSVENVAMGCGHVVGGKVQSFGGILGLGTDPISLPSQLGATSFSYCLVGSSSASTSGGTLDFNSDAPADSVTVTMVRNPIIDLYYYVELAGITVEEDQIPVPPDVYQIGSNGAGGVIVDSGTTLTYLDSQVYSSFVEAFQKNAQNLVSSPAQGGFDLCYTFSSGSLEGPAVSFQFSDGQSLALGPENYYFALADSTYCLAFQTTDQIVSIIGNIAQKGMRVTYDLNNNKIGFSPKKC